MLDRIAGVTTTETEDVFEDEAALIEDNPREEEDETTDADTDQEVQPPEEQEFVDLLN